VRRPSLNISFCQFIFERFGRDKFMGCDQFGIEMGSFGNIASQVGFFFRVEVPLRCGEPTANTSSCYLWRLATIVFVK
jgi:hypothetical protein